MYKDRINKIAQEIKNQQIAFNNLVKRFNEDIKINSFEKYNMEQWCHTAFKDSLAKVSIIAENNFNSIESFSLVSTARYICELNIRLTLIAKDSRYGLVYYGQLINDQIGYWKSFKEQLDREIIFLQDLELDKQKICEQKIDELKTISDEKIKFEKAAALATDVLKIIDDKASRKFSIHAEQAETNGYGCQAYLIKNKQLTDVILYLNSVQNEKKLYESSVQNEIIKLTKGWNWKDKARETNTLDEYEFIYTFTSRMLHATPANISTNFKQLSDQEMIMFLKYIKIKLNDINELSVNFLSQCN
ncbi:TPA: hypothetical protein ACXI1D_000943 [Proteus mirabilis]